jgi:hypothetical protein
MSIQTVVAVAIVLIVGSASASAASFGVDEFSGSALDAQGSPATQAGAHPYSISTTIRFSSHTEPVTPPIFNTRVPNEDVKDISVDLPAGLVGNPTATPRCPQREIYASDQLNCPADTQVGLAQHRLAFFDIFPDGYYSQVYNMVPPPGAPAQFAMNINGIVVVLNARVRDDGTFGLTVDVPNISQAVGLSSTRLTFWGVPADRSHDGDRGTCISAFARIGTLCPSGAPRKPFLSNPANCTAGLLTTTLHSSPWASPATVVTRSFDHDDRGNPMEVENCEAVPFDGSLAVRPVVPVAGAPSGYAFDLSIPQSDNPDGLATGHLKKAVVRLPTGVKVSPSSADGLRGCTDAEFDRLSSAAARCPDGSKIGTVTIDTPLLDNPLQGTIYLGQPTDDELLRIFIVASGSGVTVKLPGSVTPDPVTGQLTATFDNNPQLPFNNLHLEFKGGPRAALTNPPVQGTYTTTTELTSWTGKVVTSQSSFVINQGPTALGFTPDFSAGSRNPIAGGSGSFAVSFGRGDDDQNLRDIIMSMPKGLTGVVASPELCPNALASAGACAEASRVGSTSTGAGPGTTPFYLPGRVYLTEGYRDASYGLSIVVPAIAGPFDLGTVVVRAGIYVDRATAALTIKADPIPNILEGIPLQVRKVNIEIDRPGFMVNPTNCTPSEVSGQIGSIENVIAQVKSRFQVTDCARLPYKPRMTLQIGARGRTRNGITTPFVATLTMTRGQANNRVVKVVLPDTINSRLPVINRACTLDEYQTGRCEGSRVGSAEATTPLLREKLTGGVYFVRNPARRIPDVMVALSGGPIAIDVTGKVSIPPNLSLATAFDTVPDVPITKFTLKFVAGRNGPIGLIGNACQARTRRAAVARLSFTAQNGRRIDRNQRLKVVGCGKATRVARRPTSKKRRAAKTK